METFVAQLGHGAALGLLKPAALANRAASGLPTPAVLAKGAALPAALGGIVTIVVIVAASCGDGLRDDIYRCTPGGPSAQCPADWVCRASPRDGVSRCFEHAGAVGPVDGGFDGRVPEEGGLDANVAGDDADTPMDAQSIDAPPGDAGSELDLGSARDAAPIDMGAPSDGGDSGRDDGGTGAPRPVHLTAGEWHSCALYDDGSVWCWGSSSEGQLGFIGESPWGALRVAGIPPLVHLASGGRSVCGAASDGTVWCWGANFYGQSDPSSRDNPILPAEVADVAGAIEIAAGDRHTCARLTSGVVRCWGGQWHGLLGVVPADTRRVAPLDIPAAADAVEIASGFSHVCVRSADGMIRCWGANSWGQLGLGHDDPVSAPVLVPGLAAVSALALGGAHSCVRIGATATCWGSNIDAQVGLPVSGLGVTMPTAVMGVSAIEGLTAGNSHTCARRADDVVCWGNNSSHQTRAASTSISERWHEPEISSDIRAATPSDPRYDTVAAGDDHNCVIRTTGDIACWGNNLLGQLGDPTDESSTDSLVVVPGLP